MDETDGGCFQKLPMRRALGELTNSPRLLEHPSTPTKQVMSAKLSPAITPTYNLKLLTELATKLAAGGGGSSARQTLHFEDIDTNKYSSSQPVCLPLDTTSPHRDHTYGNKGVSRPKDGGSLESSSFVARKSSSATNASTPGYKFLEAAFEPKDELLDDVKLEPVVSAEEARLETGLEPSKARPPPPLSTTKPKGLSPVERSNSFAPLPPMPQESALFAPPSEKANRKDKSLGLLAEKMLFNYPYEIKSGFGAEVQLDDTAKLLNTERRRIYDIVNVFEAVQIMSKVGKNVYSWHGRTYLMQSLAWLRQLGIKLGMQDQYRAAREQERDVCDIENMSPLQSPRLVSPMMSPYGSPGMSPYGSPNDPNATSMGINTQKFLMLFLVLPRSCALTLEFAARVIHGPNPSEKAKVTRVRRLYDIANILQPLGLIKKVQIPEGKGKKPAFEYVGPNVDNISLTDEQKRSMPSARTKNSLLAVGKDLGSMPDRDDPDWFESRGGIAMKRARSLSNDRNGTGGLDAKLQRTRSVDGASNRASSGSLTGSSSLLQLGEVCQREKEKLEAEAAATAVAATSADTINVAIMKPPTPGRPPSRKKVLLQRYYSDSALQLSSQPKPHPSPVQNKLIPSPLHNKPLPSPLCNRTQPSPLQNRSSPSQNHSFASPNPVGALGSPRNLPAYSYSPRPSPRSSAVPFPSPLALKSSPLTVPLSPRQRNSLLRSPVTPRDLRNAAILPPSSPGGGGRSRYSRGVPCSPMGPVGRSLLASPASPRSPMDLSVRPTPASLRQQHGRSPLASRALNLPPSPITSTDSNSPKPLPLSKNSETSSSPLLRAYLANNKSRIFKPIPTGGGEGVTVIGLMSSMGGSENGSDSGGGGVSTTTPPPTPGGGLIQREDSVSSSASELAGIFSHQPGSPLDASTTLPPPPQSQPESLIRLPSIDTPMDFSSLLKDSSRITFRTPSTSSQSPALSSHSSSVPSAQSSLATPTFLFEKH